MQNIFLQNLFVVSQLLLHKISLVVHFIQSKLQISGLFLGNYHVVRHELGFLSMKAPILCFDCQLVEKVLVLLM